MSEMYEAILVRASETAARQAFRDLSRPFPMRLARLAEGTFGAWRVADRSVPPSVAGMTPLAAKLSAILGAALVVVYDNRSGLRVALLFRDGMCSRGFGQADEQWVPIDAQGIARCDLPPVTGTHLVNGLEYECTRDAIEVGLAEFGILPDVTRNTLKNAFCYDRATILEDSLPSTA